jgi:hypothetical protein
MRSQLAKAVAERVQLLRRHRLLAWEFHEAGRLAEQRANKAGPASEEALAHTDHDLSKAYLGLAIRSSRKRKARLRAGS